MRTRRLHAGIALITSMLVIGCASSTESSSDDGDSGVAIEEGMLGSDEGGEPVAGGSLTWGSYAEPASLDPAGTIAAAATGGVEMANIYDTLMRFDSEEQEYVPQLAESLEPDEDYQTWTLTLRDDVTFSNGEVLDAEAVRHSQERYASVSAPESALWNGNVEQIQVEDDLVVVYELSKLWPGFPSILSTGPGMIVAEEAGEAGAEDADPFSKMFATMHSKGTQVYSMYTSDEMDALLEEFQAAADFETQHEIMDRIQQQVNEDVPYLAWGPFVEITTWDSDVHGIVGGSNSLLMFDQAWIE